MMFPKKINHKRKSPKRKDVTRITQKARDEVLRRSEGKCECCGRTSAYAFEVAHLKGAAQGGSGSEPSNLALLCGPSVNTGTCHNWADYTKEGKEWRTEKRKELKQYYEQKNR